MQNLKEFLHSEKNKIENIQGLKSKVEYIWQYYYILIVSFLCAVAFIIFVIYHLFFVPKDNWIFALFNNTYAEIGNNSELWNDFKDYSGYDISEKNIYFNNVSYFECQSDTNYGNNYYESFVAYVEAGTLDLITMEEDDIVALGASGRLLDLNSDVCSDIAAKYSDRFVYCTPNDEEYSSEQVPVGIDVSDSILMTEYNIYSDNCVIALSANCPHIDAVETFLEFIFED